MYEFYELMAHSIEFLDAADADASISKADVIMSMRKRLCLFTGKLVAHPVVTDFALPCNGQNVGVSDNADLNAFFTA